MALACGLLNAITLDGIAHYDLDDIKVMRTGHLAGGAPCLRVVKCNNMTLDGVVNMILMYDKVIRTPCRWTFSDWWG